MGYTIIIFIRPCQDCCVLKDKLQSVYESFMPGGFIVSHAKRKASAGLMDQALGKACNKPAKDNIMFVGISRHKKPSSMRRQTSRTFCKNGAA